MTPRVPFLLSLVLFIGINAFSQESFDPFSEMEVVMVSSGQLYPSNKHIVDQIEFNVVLDENQDTLYVQTMDPNFKTPEGYHVNITLKDLASSDIKNLKKMNGWGYYIELKSGWQLGFCEGETCTDHKPDENATVKWIFKR